MNIVILDGSHNKKGMTNKLIDSFVHGVKSVNPKASIKRWDLLNEKIAFCKGCNHCTTNLKVINSKCSQNDVANKIKQEALGADIVVFASPIYEYCISSAMKRFLERCLTLVTFRFGPAPRAKPVKNKHGVIFCPSGAPFPINHLMGFTWYPRFILGFGCKLFGCSKIHNVFAGGMIINKNLQKKYEEKAKNLGIKTAKTIAL